MELRAGLVVDDGAVSAFALRHNVRRLAVYGSVLREDFGPSSDIDVLVEFLPGHTPGLLRVAEIEIELESILGRLVEIRTAQDLSRFFRDQVVTEARPLYAA